MQDQERDESRSPSGSPRPSAGETEANHHEPCFCFVPAGCISSRATFDRRQAHTISATPAAKEITAPHTTSICLLWKDGDPKL